jgi:outer membrane protein W
VHLHYGKTPPKVVVQSEPGRVQLAGIDFKMRGPWQVNFDVVSGGKPTLTTFQVCVQ